MKDITKQSLKTSMYSKFPHIRTYSFESQGEIGSYFKDTMTNIRGSCKPWNDITTNDEITTNNELSNYSIELSVQMDVSTGPP